VLLVVAAGMAAYLQRDRLDRLKSLWSFTAAPPLGAARSSTIRITPDQSLAAAIAAADDGVEILVEPGEYREQIRLKTGVRVTSRVPRGASLRLPGGASETDAAVVAFEVSDARFSGFRIEGDAATPLGTGIVIRNSNVVVSDVEITGARNAGVEYVGSEGGSLVAADIHDNPGAAIVVRAGASPRVAHNLFARNAGSERASGTVLVEASARPAITANTFNGVSADSVIGPGINRALIVRDNWFVNPPLEHAAPPPRSGRGRR
jgi:hypothetical protein